MFAAPLVAATTGHEWCVSNRNSCCIECADDRTMADGNCGVPSSVWYRYLSLRKDRSGFARLTFNFHPTASSAVAPSQSIPTQFSVFAPSQLRVIDTDSASVSGEGCVITLIAPSVSPARSVSLRFRPLNFQSSSEPCGGYK